MPRAPPVTTATWLLHVIAVLPLAIPRSFFGISAATDAAASCFVTFPRSSRRVLLAAHIASRDPSRWVRGIGRGALLCTQRRVPTAPAMPVQTTRALRQLPLTRPQQSARLLPVPAAWLVWSFGGPCDRAAGSKAASGNLGRRRSRLLSVDATR